MTKFIKMFIDGSWYPDSSDKKRNIINPATGEIVFESVEGTAQDVQIAVNAARKAFEPGSNWRKLTGDQRADLLNKVADLIEERADDLAIAETLCIGRLYKEIRYDDIYAASGTLRYYAGLINELQGKTIADERMLSMTVREPLGVCAVIVPWNYTIGTAIAGIAPALAAGNTVVVKPSSLTPASMMKLFEIFEEVGFPKGSVNLVLGPGEEIGRALAESEGVDKIIFTGGTATGKDIIKNSHKSIKKYSLELGGKSPFIIFEDADIDIAVDNLMMGIFMSQGQICVAGSRLLVQESVYEKTLKILKKRVEDICIGLPFDEKTEFGPMASREQMEKVLKYIEIGKQEGAKILTGGKRKMDKEFAKGYFVEPTVFCDCNCEMRIVNEEIFGPVLTVQKFADEDEAVKIANSTKFGLAGAVFTNDLGRSIRVCRNINTGLIWVNTFMEGSAGIPVSPHKQSGIGVVGGLEGLKEFTALKQINFKINPSMNGWFPVKENVKE